MLKRKHRLVVEMTTSEKMTEHDARLGLSLLLDRIDLAAQPIWIYDGSPYCDKLVAKQYTRVVRAERRKS